MTSQQAFQLPEGTELNLKLARQAAYGLSGPIVTFKAIKSIPGRATPFLFCSYGENTGFFKPSDFQPIIVSRPMWQVLIERR